MHVVLMMDWRVDGSGERCAEQDSIAEQPNHVIRRTSAERWREMANARFVNTKLITL